jgi:signal transduction histidine kinase
MESSTTVQTGELVTHLTQWVTSNRADLLGRYRKCLQETLFTNRSEVHPRELGRIAEEEVDELIGAFSQPESAGLERGSKLCRAGLSIQTILSLNQATQRFILANFENDLIAQALDIVDIYRNAVIRGFVQSLEKVILTEQERIRGALQMAIGTYTVEIKEVQELARKAAEANEFKIRFIARISHEVRTPLGALLGMSEMLQENVYGSLSPAQMDITQRIIKNANALERIFTELLDQSQIELGQLRLKEVEISPQELVQEVYSSNLSLALQKGLAMHVEIDSTLPKLIIGDKLRIEQILSNLVINAIKYTDSGSILIRAHLESTDQWSLQVRDSGVGISKDEQAFIFEPFHQVDETLGRKYGGVGLGLAIVQQLVMVMKGSVNVVSEPGQGSTFTVVLPLRTSQKLG